MLSTPTSRANWTFIPFEVNGGKLLLQPSSILAIQMEYTLYPTPLQVFTQPGLTERATHSVKVVN